MNIFRSFRQTDPVFLEPWLVIHLFDMIWKAVDNTIAVLQSVGKAWSKCPEDDQRETSVDSRVRRRGLMLTGISLFAMAIVGAIAAAAVVFTEAHTIAEVFSCMALLEKEAMAGSAVARDYDVVWQPTVSAQWQPWPWPRRAIGRFCQGCGLWVY